MDWRPGFLAVAKKHRETQARRRPIRETNSKLELPVNQS